MAYSDKVLDHYENPRNVGSMDKNDKEVGTGMVGAPACGDVMKLQIKIEDDIVKDAVFKTYGCGSAIASSSLVTEWVKGVKHWTKQGRLRIQILLMNWHYRQLRYIVLCWPKMLSRPL